VFSAVHFSGASTKHGAAIFYVNFQW